MTHPSDRYPGFPTDFAAEFDATVARIDDIRAQMDALRTELRPLAEQREAILDLYAETTDDPTTLLTLSRATRIAHRKVETQIRSLHPYLYSYSEYLFNDWDNEGNPKGETTVLVGPHVSLMKHSSRPLSTDEASTLAAALVEFATRYVTDPIGLLPEWGMGDHTGMIQCDLLTEHDDSPVLWYTPDGSRAAYYADTNNGHTGYTDPTTGTLVQVLARAIKDAARPTETDHNFN